MEVVTPEGTLISLFLPVFSREDSHYLVRLPFRIRTLLKCCNFLNQTVFEA